MSVAITQDGSGFVRNSGEPAEPFPRRFGWLKRAGVGMVVLAIVLTVAWWRWSVVAHRRLQRQLDAIAARGEPLTTDTLISTMHSGSARGANAAALLDQAMAAINMNVDCPRSSNLTYPDTPPYPPAWHQLADASAKAQAPAYALARQARSASRIEWNIQFSHPLFTTLLPTLNQARHLANHLADAATWSHLHGDDYEAIERLRDLRFMASAMERQPFLVAHLVSIGINAMAMNAIHIIAPGLKISDDPRDATTTAPSTAPIVRPATRGQIRALIADILDESDGRDGLRRALLFERVAMLDMMNWLGRGTVLLTPLLEIQTARMLADQEVYLRATDEVNFPAAAAVMSVTPQLPQTRWPPPGTPRAAKPPRIQVPPRYTNVPGGALAFSWNRALETDMRVRGERRMAAISLAAQLYRADHAGQWPANLEALVPRYLPAVPRDPLAAGDRALGYLLLKSNQPGVRDRPIVYSVGSNGRDDTQDSGAVPPPNPQYSWGNLLDEWRDLSRWTPPPSTLPTSGESDE
jgi:hypothetical protein